MPKIFHLEDESGFLSQAWNIFDIFNEFLYRGLPGQSLGRKQLTALVRSLVKMTKYNRSFGDVTVDGTTSCANWYSVKFIVSLAGIFF